MLSLGGKNISFCSLQMDNGIVASCNNHHAKYHLMLNLVILEVMSGKKRKEEKRVLANLSLLIFSFQDFISLPLPPLLVP